MNIFSRFNNLTDNLPSEVVIEIWKSKFNAVGLILTPKDEQKIERLIKEQTSDITLNFINADFENTKFKNKNEVASFVKKSLKESYKEAEKAIPEILQDVITGTIEDSSQDIFIDLKNDQERMLLNRGHQKKEFEYFLNYFWSKPFKTFETLLKITSEIFERFSGATPDSSKYEALIPLYLRACQTAAEIYSLLINGYSDGAHARWRTLHELCVTSIFIIINDNDLAERYLDYEHVEEYYIAKNFYSVHGKNSEEDRRNSATLEEMFNTLIEKYDRNFTKQYGWASKVLNDHKPNFSKIEKKLNLDYMRPDFKFACDNIHAGVRGNHFRIGGTNDYPLLMGPSYIGLSEAGINSVHSLNKMLEYFFKDETTIESMVYLNVFQKFADNCVSEFIEAEEKAQRYNNGEIEIGDILNNNSNLQHRKQRRCSQTCKRRNRVHKSISTY